METGVVFGNDIYWAPKSPPSYRTHPDHAAFIRAICATPQDDLPRLIYCDWLEDYAADHGDAEASERATFIRLQIQSEHTENEADAFELDDRCRMIIEKLPPWATELGRVLSNGRDYVEHGYGGAVGGMRWEWSRGFIGKVKCTLAQFEAHAAQIAASHPIAEDGWVLTDVDRYLRASNTPYDSTEYYWSGFPDAIWNELARVSGFTNPFPSREAAMTALQKAAFIVARKQAGIEVAND